MNFDDYINAGRIVIDNDFSEGEKNLILVVMRTAYAVSPTAKRMFDDWFSSDITKKININFKRGKCQSYSNTGILEIDLKFIDKVVYIDNNGTAVKHTPVTAIVHELVHALTNKLDDGVGAPDSRGDRADYKGATVIHSNLIYSELDSVVKRL
jgi:hypothetical protein